MNVLADIPNSEVVLGVENSLNGKRWVLRECDERTAYTISQRHGLPEILGRILAARGIDAEAAGDYLNPTLKNLLPDPSHLIDMDVAAARLAQAITSRESVAVFGDYDVDGATSSALLKRYFDALGIPLTLYIPDRMKEGYGPNALALIALQQKGIRIVVTVDCGTVAFDALAAAKEAGLEVIVIDHHAGEIRTPDAVALVNPNRFDEISPHRHLAAVGVTFLLIIALNRALRAQGFFVSQKEPDILSLLDIVALGTVCDVVPLTGINRAFVVQGLKVMAQRKNVGLRVLGDLAGMQEKPTTYHLGYVLGPRINAGGRVGRSDLGVRLLTTQDEEEALSIAQELEKHNAERKAIEAMVLEEAVTLAERQSEKAMVVVAKTGWHQGVIGIVAGRLKERFDTPSAVIALENGVGKASARSVPGVDLGAIVTSAKEAGILLAGGGHAMAAGFSIAEERIEDFIAFAAQHMRSLPQPTVARGKLLKLDGCIDARGATLELAKLIDSAGPYGAGNSPVRLVLTGVKVQYPKLVGENHLSVSLVPALAGAGGGRLKAIAFRAGDTRLGEALAGAGGRILAVAGQLQINHWQGSEGAQFVIDDAAFA